MYHWIGRQFQHTVALRYDSRKQAELARQNIISTFPKAGFASYFIPRPDLRRSGPDISRLVRSRQSGGLLNSLGGGSIRRKVEVAVLLLHRFHLLRLACPFSWPPT